MFDDHDTAANRAFLVDRLVPEDEVTFRVLAAAVEDAAPLGLTLDERPLAALGTSNAQVFDNGLGIATFREIRASQEFAETAEFIDHGRAAEFTDLSRILARNRDLFHLFFGFVHFRFENIIKFLQDVAVRILALLDGVQFFFHVGRKADVDDLGEIFFQ